MAFGRLERTAAPAPMSDINMTPLIDVMLVLVVILLITAPLLSSSIALELPRTDAGTASPTTASVGVSIDAAGQVYLGGQALSLTQLALRLEQLQQQQPGAEVQLRADQRVPYGRVMAVMALAQKAGLHRIGFVADPRPVVTEVAQASGKP